MAIPCQSFNILRQVTSELGFIHVDTYPYSNLIMSFCRIFKTRQGVLKVSQIQTRMVLKQCGLETQYRYFLNGESCSKLPLQEYLKIGL